MSWEDVEPYRVYQKSINSVSINKRGIAVFSKTATKLYELQQFLAVKMCVDKEAGLVAITLREYSGYKRHKLYHGKAGNSKISINSGLRLINILLPRSVSLEPYLSDPGINDEKTLVIFDTHKIS